MNYRSDAFPAFGTVAAQAGSVPEDPGRIFHYTSVDSLAMILSSRRLRFSRLDGVDDVHEAQTLAEIDFGKYFFVSCWTTEEEESIPQWSMYSHEMRGVRIELPSYPFLDRPLRPNNGWSGVEWSGKLLSPIPFEEIWTDTYFVAPMFLDRKHFAGPVDYVPSVKKIYEQAIRRETGEASESLRIEGLPLLPRKKMSQWFFQKEYRFSLFALPSRPVPEGGPGTKEFSDTIGQYMSESFLRNVDPGIFYIDVSLSPTALDNAVIRVGPLAPAGTRVCVEALLTKFAPRARLEASSLSGAVRSRGR